MSNSTTAAKKGNGCGHDPENPRFFEPANHPHTGQHFDRPKYLKQLTKAVNKYVKSPKILPTLNAANGSIRQQRSERREACCALLGVLIHYLDITTLRIGIPQLDGSMKGIPMASKDLEDGGRIVGLAELAGLGVRRAERAIKDLKAAGILAVHPICKKIEETVYKGHAAIRTVSVKFFDALGLGRWLAHERRRAKERRDKKLEKARLKASANVFMAMGAQKDAKPPLSLEEMRAASAMTGGLKKVQDIAFESMHRILGRKPKDSS